MLSREQYSYMTDYIKRQYGYSADWCKKVNKMPDDQVFAIFCRLQEAERASKPKKLNKALKADDIPLKSNQSLDAGEQLTIWGLIQKGDSA